MGTDIFCILGFKDHSTSGIPGVIERRSWFETTCTSLPDERYDGIVDRNKDGYITKPEAWIFHIWSHLVKDKSFLTFIKSQRNIHFAALVKLCYGKTKGDDNYLFEYLKHNIDTQNPNLTRLIRAIIAKFTFANPDKLLALINHSNPDIRAATISYLSGMKQFLEQAGESGHKITNQIIGKLDDPKRHVRIAATKAIGEFGLENAHLKLITRFRPKIYIVLDNESIDDEERNAQIKTLIKLGKIEEAFLQKLLDDNPENRDYSIYELSELKKNKSKDSPSLSQEQASAIAERFAEEILTRIPAADPLERTFFIRDLASLRQNDLLSDNFLRKISVKAEQQIRALTGIQGTTRFFNHNKTGEALINEFKQKLLSDLPKNTRNRIKFLLQKQYNPCPPPEKCSPGSTLPQNCHHTVMFSAFRTTKKHFEEDMFYDDSLKYLMGISGYKQRYIFSPFTFIPIKQNHSPIVSGLNNNAFLKFSRLLKPGDILIFGYPTSQGHSYVHSAFNLGMLNGKSYMFQKPSFYCGPDSSYELISLQSYLEDYLKSSIGTSPNTNEDSAVEAIYVYRR